LAEEKRQQNTLKARPEHWQQGRSSNTHPSMIALFLGDVNKK